MNTKRERTRLPLLWLVVLLTSSMGPLTGAAPVAPYTLRTVPTTVHVGETYAVWFEPNAYGDSLHDVVLDRMSASADAQAGRAACENRAVPCRFWRPYTATAVGRRVHVVNGRQSTGQPWGEVSVAVNVRPEPAYAAEWELNQVISNDSRIFQGIAASNGVVLVSDSDAGSNTTRVKRSMDRGQTFGAWTILPGNGTAYIEQPVAIDGPFAVVLGVDATENVTDFCCPRQVGPMVAWRSTDAGLNWTRHVISSAAKALRVSIAVEGAFAHATWMDYRRGVWDVYYARSLDHGATWVEQVVALGTNTIGAERPAIALNGSTVWLSWMDARDSQAPCRVEGEALLAFCPEIYVGRSDDNGATFNVSRLTEASGFVGRPIIDVAGAVVTVAFDFRDSLLRLPNQIMVTSSVDGVRWAPARALSPSATEQSHVQLASVGGVTETVWIDSRTGRNEIRAQPVAGRPSRIADDSRPAADQRLTSGSSAAGLASDDAYVYAVSQVGTTIRLLRKFVGDALQPPPRFARPRS